MRENKKYTIITDLIGQVLCDITFIIVLYCLLKTIGLAELGLYNYFSSTVYKEVCFPGNAYNIDLQLTGYNGTLRSPLRPDIYPPGSSCYWLITVPEGKTVKLRFDSFKLESSSGCTADYVEILDGKLYYSRSIGKFCGSTTPKDIL